MTHPHDPPPLTRRSLLLGAAGALAAHSLAFASESSLLPKSPGVRALDCQLHLPDGRCLGYAEYGAAEGPLVLFFHGTPGSRFEAALFAEEALECGVRIVAIDRPCVGKSSCGSNRRVCDWPSDVEAVVGSLGYGDTPFGVIGFSGGAPYALACVKRIPHRLTHVALCSGHTPMAEPGSGSGNQDEFIEFLLRRPRIANVLVGEIVKQVRKHPDKMMERIASQTTPQDEKLLLCDPANHAGFHANLLAATHYGAGGVMVAISRLANYWGFHLADLPPAPISIWQGGCDPVAPPAAGNYFHRKLAGSEMFVDPTAGHVTMLKWHAKEILSRFV